MSKDALKDIQQALNIIRSATDKEQYANKVKAMELVTQSLLSQIQTLKPLAVVKNKAQHTNLHLCQYQNHSTRQSLQIVQMLLCQINPIPKQILQVITRR